MGRMSLRRILVVAAIAFVAFVVSATGHGRQLRAERESHGFHQMDPQSGWPEPLHVIWRADRTTLQVGTVAAAVVGVGAAVATGGGLKGALLALLLWAPTLGFAIAGAASVLRGPAISPSGIALVLVAIAGLLASAKVARTTAGNPAR